MRYWILVFLYAALVIYYAWNTPRPTFSKWPVLQKDAEKNYPEKCKRTSECPPNHICMNETCVPQLLRGEECYSETGKWTLVSHRGKSFAACICLNPNLMTQKHFGGNCDVDVACKPHGYFNMHSQRCVCSEGYVSLDTPECRKISVIDRMKYESCEPDEVHFSQLTPSDGITASYKRRHQDKKCFKRPCTFDAMTGKPLKKARYELNVGCVCDPTLGQFGVRIDGLDDYMVGKGYNGCVSLFETPLENPIPVEIFSYFYLLDKDPVTYLQYNDLNPSSVIAPLRDHVQKGALQIAQEFPYDYMQIFLREKQPFQAKIYNYTITPYLYGKLRLDWEMQPNRMEWCRFMTRHLKKYNTNHGWANEIVYKFPACYIGKDDLKADEKYRGKFVSNPFHMTFPEWPFEPRSNGLVLKFKDNVWTLEFAPDYNIKRYSQATEHVPDWNDSVVKEFVNRTLTGKDIEYREALYHMKKQKMKWHGEPIF